MEKVPAGWLTAANESFHEAVSEAGVGETKDGLAWNLLGDLSYDLLPFLRRLPDHQQAGEGQKDRHHRSLVAKQAHDGKLEPHNGQHERADSENKKSDSPTFHGQSPPLRTAEDPFVAEGDRPKCNRSKASLPPS